MKTTLEDVGPWQKAIAIELDVEEVEREMDQVVSRYRQKAVIPGFRRGKVPTDLVRSTYRSSLESDLLNQILPEATQRAVDEHALQLAAPPRIRDLHFHPGEPLRFTALIDVWPVVQVQGFEKLEVEEIVYAVEEEMVEAVVEGLRERHARLIPVSRPSQAGDVLEVSLQAVDVNGARLPRSKRQTISMEADSEKLLPEFREASLGREPGSVQIVRIQYPDDFEDPELAGKQRHYEMRIKQILEKILPDLDDSLAERIGGVESLEALRSKVRLRLETEERLKARQRTEEAVIDRLIHQNPFDLPDGIVDRSLDRAWEKTGEKEARMSEEEFREAYRPIVVRLRKREILLDSLAAQQSLEVTEEGLMEQISQSAPPGIDPRIVRQKLERDGELERVRGELRERKVFDFLLEQATVQRIHQPRERRPASNIILP